jgi:hypothetical protein
MASAAERVCQCLQGVILLRGMGPISYDYGQWVDASHHTLVALFGAHSPQARGFLAIVGEGAGARGWGLPLAPGHPWGMQARLGRVEAYLRGLLEQLESGG